tara:strand:+ start:324 stop:500 length:177 start_codon:yes stop_codon:yes gene_type:complete
VEDLVVISLLVGLTITGVLECSFEGFVTENVVESFLRGIFGSVTGELDEDTSGLSEGV